MTEKKKRPYNDDEDSNTHLFDNDDIDQLINRLNFNRQLANSYKMKDQQHKQKLDSLKTQLKQLNSGKLEDYKNQLNQIEVNYNDTLAMIRLWYQIKKSEIEYQFEFERKTIKQDFQEKRKEIKDNLKYEYEEKRRIIEAEKQSLDINLDSNEVKPAITRKLRRRVNQNQSNNQNHEIPFSTLLLNSSTIQPNVSQMTLTSITMSNSSVSNLPNVLNVQNVVSQQEQRKRRPSPTQIFITLNEDDINDDLKYLSKNSNLQPSQILTVFNSMQQQQQQQFALQSDMYDSVSS